MKIFGLLVIRCQTTLPNLGHILPSLPITFATYKQDQWTFVLQGRTDKIREKLDEVAKKFPCEYVIYVDDTHTLQKCLPNSNKPNG